MKIRVYYEDTDEQGIVYYANYLKFCERARSEIFFSNNINIFTKESYFVVKNINANYIDSAKLGNILEVKTELKELNRVSLVLIHKIFRDDKEIFNCEVTLVSMSNNKISKIKADFKELMLQFVMK